MPGSLESGRRSVLSIPPRPKRKEENIYSAFVRALSLTRRDLRGRARCSKYIPTRTAVQAVRGRELARVAVFSPRAYQYALSVT